MVPAVDSKGQMGVQYRMYERAKSRESSQFPAPENACAGGAGNPATVSGAALTSPRSEEGGAGRAK